MKSRVHKTVPEREGPKSLIKKMLTSFIGALIYGQPLTHIQLPRPIEVLMRLDKP